jgi:hypothetical protein
MKSSAQAHDRIDGWLSRRKKKGTEAADAPAEREARLLLAKQLAKAEERAAAAEAAQAAAEAKLAAVTAGAASSEGTPDASGDSSEEAGAPALPTRGAGVTAGPGPGPEPLWDRIDDALDDNCRDVNLMQSLLDESTTAGYKHPSVTSLVNKVASLRELAPELPEIDIPPLQIESIESEG